MEEITINKIERDIQSIKKSFLNLIQEYNDLFEKNFDDEIYNLYIFDEKRSKTISMVSKLLDEYLSLLKQYYYKNKMNH